MIDVSDNRRSTVYEIQQDTQCFMIDFIQNTCLTRHVSDLNGPSSERFQAEDGLLSSETCRATKCYEKNSIIKHCVSCCITYILEDVTRSIQYQVT